MKKTYQAPETLLEFMVLSELLVEASNNYGQPEQGQDLSTVGETTEVSGNLGRRTIWDDEDDYEDEF